MPRSIVILLANGFADSGVAIALDVFRTANALSTRAGRTAPFSVRLASASGGSVRSASGAVTAETQTARVASRAHVVLTPGLWVEAADEMDAVLGRSDVRALVRTIAMAHDRGAIVGSSCGGAFLLGDAGLLDGRSCTTTWWLAPALKRRRPAALVDAKASLVVDDRVLTAGALFAQADLVLHLVTRFAGPEIAQRCTRLLLIDSHPSQASYMAVRALAANDVTVRAAERWVRKHITGPFDIATLSRQLGVSPRTLARRLEQAVGLAPIAFVQRIRVEEAVHLLGTTSLSFGQIAERVGYVDTGALRRLIQREMGASPRALRPRTSAEPRADRENEALRMAPPAGPRRSVGI